MKEFLFLIVRNRAVSGEQLQTHVNYVLELHLRSWSPPCGGDYHSGRTVAVRVTIMIKVRVNDKVRVRVLG